MPYEQKNFSHLIGMEGLSETLLTNHFTLYEGYVKNTNTLVDLLKQAAIGTPEYAELHRRFGWEWNGMRLHELYFENMSMERSSFSGEKLGALIDSTWGSFENWKNDFVGCGAMRGIGWVVLALDEEHGKLFNLWINEHDLGHLAGAKPILVMDVFEHAYMIDYGLKKADYLNTFFDHIDWTVVEGRIQ